jgi:hypothetical protein
MSHGRRKGRSPKIKTAILISELLVTALVVAIKATDLVHHIGQT